MNKSKIVLWLFLTSLMSACSTTQTISTSSEAEYSPEPVQASSHNKHAPAPYADLAKSSNSQMRSEERLGTKWGDEISSHVTQVDLKRLSYNPIDETQIRYANKKFSGRNVNSISLVAGKISFSIVDDRGRILPLYRDDQTYYLVANEGQSYQLRYSNTSAQTFEIVASVDGLDVLDGAKASRSKSGYVLRPYSSFAIEGFRKSNSSVASFTFSKPKDAYAANSANGSIQNTGVIGTVIYELKAPQYQPSNFPPQKPQDRYAPSPNAFPAD